MIWLVKKKKKKITGRFILVLPNVLFYDFRIESELVWFNFSGNGTSFLAGKTNQKRTKSSSIWDH